MFLFCLYYLANVFFLFVYTICEYCFVLRHYVTIILLLHITVVSFYYIITAVLFSSNTMFKHEIAV